MSSPSNEVRPPTEEQVRDDLMRLDLYRSQLSQMLQQHQMISASRSDHQRARETLEGLDRPDRETELLVPVGGDTFVRGAPKDTGHVLLGIGSGVVVEMERSKASEVLAERLVRLDQAGRDLEGQMHALEERITVLSNRLEALNQSADRTASDASDADVGRD